MKLSTPVFLMLSGKPQTIQVRISSAKCCPSHDFLEELQAKPSTRWVSAISTGLLTPAHVSHVRREDRTWRLSAPLKKPMQGAHIPVSVIRSSGTWRFVERSNFVQAANTTVASRGHFPEGSEILARHIGYMYVIVCTHGWMEGW